MNSCTRRRALCMVALALVWLGYSSLLPAQTGAAGVEVEVFYPRQWIRGQATEISISGKGLDSVDSVSLTPAEGLAVREIKKKEDGAWMLVVFAEPAAELTKRSAVVVTPQGSSEPLEVEVVTHVPELSNFVVTHREAPGPRRNAPRINFTVAAFDAEGDIGTSPQLNYVLMCGRGGDALPSMLVFGSPIQPGQQVQDPQRRTLTGSVPGSDAQLVLVPERMGDPINVCDVVLMLKDEKGYESREFKMKVDLQAKD
ncbi:MAG: hypothetical protein ACRD5I_09385 [Candidatus Acidiferrales bacterium]